MNFKTLWFLSILLFFFSQSANAQRKLGIKPTNSGVPIPYEQAAIDITSYSIDLEVFPKSKSIRSDASLAFTCISPTSLLLFDLHDSLQVSSIHLSSHSTPIAIKKYTHQNGQIQIYLKRSLQPQESLTLVIQYSGQPKSAPKPPWVGGFTWAKTQSGEHWITSSVQFDGADLWLPCKDQPSDEPDSVYIAITVPKGLTAVSNGKLINHTNTQHTSTFEWTINHPINNYNIAINIGPFEHIQYNYTNVLGEPMPIQWWVLPEDKMKAKKKLEEFADHLKFYETYLGPYPFRSEKYGIVQTPYLGMEHQTIIAYGSDFKNNEFGWDFLHHHELGHEWWGNLVSVSDWKDFWIHEGFCIYMQALYNEYKFGKKAYHQYFNTPRSKVRNLQALAPYESQSTLDKYFLAPCYKETDGDIYTKGALVLHNLRYLIGDKAFFECLRKMAYPNKEMELLTNGKQCRFVSSTDFIELVNTVTQKDYTWFFDVYLRQPELPQLITNWNNDTLYLKWKTPNNLPFNMPIELKTKGGIKKYLINNSTFSFHLPDTSHLDIDPHNWIYKKSNWREKQQLRQQLTAQLKLSDIQEIPAPDHFKQAYHLVINQPIDHSRPDDETFEHHVLLYHSGYNQPTIYETEGYQLYRGTRELSQLTNGNQVQVEYRFYGQSKPDSIPWEFLTNDQAIEDLHLLKNSLNTIYKGKWISTGVSKGGETTLIYKSKYPDDVSIAVPYVAPIILAREDTRTEKHITTIGEASCRAAITEFQRTVLKNRNALKEEIKNYSIRKELTFSIGLDVALEYAALEFPFSFWQWGGNCTEIPTTNASPKETFNYLNQIVGISFYSDQTLERLLPSYYQHMKELGYYGFNTQTINDLLTHVKTPNNAFFAPQGVDLTYNPNYMKDVLHSIEQTKKGNNILYIYGEYDTWGACAVTPSEKLDALKMVLKSGSHGTRIRHFSSPDREKIYKQLEKWLEQPLNAQYKLCK